MKVCVNGVVREATPEEVAAHDKAIADAQEAESEMPSVAADPEDATAEDYEEALRMLGVDL